MEVLQGSPGSGSEHGVYVYTHVSQDKQIIQVEVLQSLVNQSFMTSKHLCVKFLPPPPHHAHMKRLLVPVTTYADTHRHIISSHPKHFFFYKWPDFSSFPRSKQSPMDQHWPLRVVCVCVCQWVMPTSLCRCHPDNRLYWDLRLFWVNHLKTAIVQSFGSCKCNTWVECSEAIWIRVSSTQRHIQYNLTLNNMVQYND